MSAATILAFASAGVGIAVAFLAAFRERRSAARWFFVAGLGLLAVETIFSGFTAAAVRNFSIASAAGAGQLLDALQEKIRYWENWRLGMMVWSPGFWLLFSLTYARGNSREFLSKWRWLLVTVFALSAALTIFCWGRLAGSALLPGGDQTDWFFPLTPSGWVLFMLRLLSAIFVLMQLERTFWAAVGTMRWRVKFMLLGLAVWFAVQVYTGSQALFPPELQTHPGPQFSQAAVDSVALLLACLLISRSLFRGDLDVVVYPARSGLHKSVAVLVAGIYLLIVGVLVKVQFWLGLTDSFPWAFLILVLLVLAALLLLSDRARMYTRRFISRYLQRPLYDYRTVWRRFTEGTASRLTGNELCQASVNLTADLFQALSVAIWLVDDNRENLTFAASTSLSEAAAEKVRPTREEAGEIIAAMRTRADAVDIDSSKDDWSRPLRNCHPSEFEHGGSRLCVPMIAAGELLGLMILGDRVGGVFFSLEEIDLLKCVGDQIAAGLLNSQLSRKLLQAKELEAFQTMSAFFVHDLKNTASTLNLMLQNLPIHFANPAFREDALRGIAKTGQHINNLISRLGLLRHDLQIRPVESDLNQVVSKVLTSWDGATNVRLLKDLGSIPKAMLDEDQIGKVVTNLILNAAEAVSREGQIRVETSRGNGWVVLLVADNGCGMAPEFLNRSLFRPFQTTKKDGFGIGMFQSKMIVEAHGGRVEVQSEVNKGTTFRVLLPIKENIK